MEAATWLQNALHQSGICSEVEESTRGSHLYLMAEKPDSLLDYKQQLRTLNKLTHKIASFYDVECGEAKGGPTLITEETKKDPYGILQEWEEKTRKSVVYGSLAQLPRDPETFYSLFSHPTTPIHDLIDGLQTACETLTATRQPRMAILEQTAVTKGRTIGSNDTRLFRDEHKIVMDEYLIPLCEELIEDNPLFNIDPIDLAQKIMTMFLIRPNLSGHTMPTACLRGFTMALFESGEFTKSFCYKRNKKLRTYLAECGLIDVVDSTYFFDPDSETKVRLGLQPYKGKSMEYKLSDAVTEQLKTWLGWAKNRLAGKARFEDEKKIQREYKEMKHILYLLLREGTIFIPCLKYPRAEWERQNQDIVWRLGVLAQEIVSIAG